MDLSPCEKTQLLADKWRHERNFWMAALAVTLWIVLNRFYSLNQKNLDLCVPAILVTMSLYPLGVAVTVPVLSTPCNKAEPLCEGVALSRTSLMIVCHRSCMLHTR